VAAVRLADVFSAANASANYHGMKSSSAAATAVPSNNNSADSVFDDVEPETVPATASVTPNLTPAVASLMPMTHNNTNASLSNERFAVVEFKHELCTYKAPFRVAEGDFVVVEADRGEHAGVVRHVLTEKPQFNVPCRILRRASQREEQAIHGFAEREDQTTAQIQKMSDAIGLPLRIVDSEFYLDGNKLTVFFASKTQVDFRKLQRSLFREFRCRIWLINYSEVQYRNKHFRNRK
jgi:hypothetical protein